MSVTTGDARQGLGAYLRIVRRPVAVRPFAAAVVGRLPISMAPLGIVLLVEQTTGSYTRAGAVTGAYAVGSAIGAPLWGRALDRWGQPRIIALSAALNAVLIAAVAIGATSGAALGFLLTVGLLAGLSLPPLTPAMRAAWRAALDDPATVRAAYALDAVAVETIFIAGPLLLSLLLVVSAPVVPLLVTAGLTLVGGLAYATTSASRRARTDGGLPDRDGDGGAPGVDPAAGRTLRRLLTHLLPLGLVPVLLIGLGLAVAFGAIDTSLAATAQDVLGDQARLGVLFAAIAGGSAVSGLWFGTRDTAHETQVRLLPLLLAAVTAGLLPIAIVLGVSTPALWVLLPLLFVTGVGISPSLIILQNLIDVAAPARRVNEGQAWLATSITAGAGIGTAVAGALIDVAGIPWSFATAGIAAVIASTLAGSLLWRHRRHRWPAPDPSTNRSSP